MYIIFMWNTSPTCFLTLLPQQERTVWGLYLGSWRSWSPGPRPSQGLWPQDFGDDFPMTKIAGSMVFREIWTRCEDSLEPKIFYLQCYEWGQHCTSCTTEILPDVSELKRLQNSWVQILYCSSTYPQFWDLLGAVRLAKNVTWAGSWCCPLRNSYSAEFVPRLILLGEGWRVKTMCSSQHAWERWYRNVGPLCFYHPSSCFDDPGAPGYLGNRPVWMHFFCSCFTQTWLP